jgi:hypothetical protein
LAGETHDIGFGLGPAYAQQQQKQGQTEK